ncbi:MAG: NYN domain-containing protein [Candidatus Thorarchaeota archaeon]|nr:MAG: NYN domain-containing protein [Candidatus Thorarchaeota archaeon]
MTETDSATHLAVFWDVENVHDDSDTHRTMTEAIHSLGTVDRMYAFADWDNRRELAEDLYSLGYDLVHIPSDTENAADYKMAAYIIDHLMHYSETTNYVLITGDGDFKLVLGALRQKGLQIWLISNPLITASDLFDLATKYTDIHSYRPSAIECRDPSECDASLMGSDEYRRIVAVKLQEAIRAVVDAGNKPGMGHVKHVMVSLNPDFNEILMGFSGWTEFLEWAESEGYVSLEGTLPGTLLTVPESVTPETVKIVNETKTAYETFVKLVEDRVDQGASTEIQALDEGLEESGVEYEDIGYQRMTDFVISAEKRGLVRVLAADEAGNPPTVIPHYTVEQLRDWFEANVERLFGPSVNVPKDIFLKKISEMLLENKATLKQLESCLERDDVRESYSAVLKASGIPYLPPYQQILLLALLGRGVECSDAIVRVNYELGPIGITLQCPA